LRLGPGIRYQKTGIPSGSFPRASHPGPVSAHFAHPGLLVFLILIVVIIIIFVLEIFGRMDVPGGARTGLLPSPGLLCAWTYTRTS
jgi:hypothetical protein